MKKNTFWKVLGGIAVIGGIAAIAKKVLGNCPCQGECNHAEADARNSHNEDEDYFFESPDAAAAGAESEDSADMQPEESADAPENSAETNPDWVGEACDEDVEDEAHKPL